jgi:hypothetical protein
VQLRDLDSDGVNEALAFFGTGGEHPLRICVYRVNDDGTYETVSVIEGDGTGIERVYYTDMDADGFTDLIVGWSQGSGINMLTVISLRDFVPAKLTSTDYTEFIVADLDGDKRDDLAVVRIDEATQTGAVDIYSLRANDELFTAYAPLSSGLESISKLGVGNLSDGRVALFLDGAYQGGTITDIFTMDNDMWSNITLDKKNNVSSSTVRAGVASYRDINTDGITEVPRPRTLPGNGEVSYRVLDWYSIDSNGKDTFILTTYHNSSDGWYLIVPTDWRGKVTAHRSDLPGEHSIIFSLWNGDSAPPDDFLTIYTLSGENRSDRAGRPGRFRLRVVDEIIYAAELLSANFGWDNEIDENYLRDNFKLIYSDWDTGL